MLCRIIILLFLPLSFIHAQKTKAPDALWTSLGFSLKFNSKWSNVTDAGYRTYSAGFIPYTVFIRNAVRYNLNKRWNLGAGAWWLNQRTTFNKENHEYGSELRLYAEISRTTAKSTKGIFNHRFRFEEKFFEATSMKPATNYQRISYRLLTGLQFTKKFSMQVGPEWYVSFINKKFNFDQFRFNILSGIQLGSKFAISAGYFYLLKKTSYQNIYTVTLNKNLQWHEQHHQ